MKTNNVTSKCRICSYHKQNLIEINNKINENEISYSDMIYSLSGIKVQQLEDDCERLCDVCCRKLEDAYNFKIKILKSLGESKEDNKFYFDNIRDIKEIDFPSMKKSYSNDTKIVCKMQLLAEKDIISYHNVIIKKRSYGSTTEPVPISGSESLPELNFEDDLDCYQSDGDLNNEYLPLKQNRDRSRKRTTQDNANVVFLNVPVKPVMMKDLKYKHIIPRRKLKSESEIRVKKKRICQVCGKLTERLNSHMASHTEKIFSCDLCNRKYRNKILLATHISRVHEKKVYPHKCSQCVASFIDIPTLKRHSLTHSNLRVHLCDICSKSYKTKSALGRHKLLHNSANKSFKCDLCNMSFFDKYGLSHHMRVHTGERPYKCEICSQPYSYKHDFNRHCFNKHGILLKRRSVHIMNEEVLQRELALMNELKLRARGLIGEGEMKNPFEGPQGAMAFEIAMKTFA